ncbi:uncharacterized protein LOC134851279 isoform X2 [Symsagittifera roscoffensis]|uniref:uncharacterized protein LOC134851279 isoform X2 n=1 Tax=Symsagittifera roscoffensis TaxID=84072 RepID=UPI00307BF8AE
MSKTNDLDRLHYAFGGHGCKVSLFKPRQKTPKILSFDMTKDLNNNSICLHKIDIEKGIELCNLLGIHVEFVVEGKTSLLGWFNQFEQSETEFMLAPLQLRQVDQLKEIVLCIPMQYFNLSEFSTSRLIKATAVVTELAIDYSDPNRVSHQETRTIIEMSSTSISGQLFVYQSSGTSKLQASFALAVCPFLHFLMWLQCEI